MSGGCGLEQQVRSFTCQQILSFMIPQYKEFWTKSETSRTGCDKYEARDDPNILPIGSLTIKSIFTLGSISRIVLTLFCRKF